MVSADRVLNRQFEPSNCATGKKPAISTEELLQNAMRPDEKGWTRLREKLSKQYKLRTDYLDWLRDQNILGANEAGLPLIESRYPEKGERFVRIASDTHGFTDLWAPAGNSKPSFVCLGKQKAQTMFVTDNVVTAFMLDDAELSAGSEKHGCIVSDVDSTREQLDFMTAYCAHSSHVVIVTLSDNWAEKLREKIKRHNPTVTVEAHKIRSAEKETNAFEAAMQADGSCGQIKDQIDGILETIRRARCKNLTPRPEDKKREKGQEME